MLRGPLYQEDYRPQFSGHETFPLRYGWLKKAFDEVLKTEDSEKNRTVFSGEDAIARFGVGKNMVASMRHWATVMGVIRDTTVKGRTETTQLGRCLFGRDGLTLTWKTRLRRGCSIGIYVDNPKTKKRHGSGPLTITRESPSSVRLWSRRSKVS